MCGSAEADLYINVIIYLFNNVVSSDNTRLIVF
jgi:hypothetical protein